MHRSTWSNLERGRLGQMAVETVRRYLAVLEVTLDLVPRWRGSQLDRLMDENHARMQTAWKERLERWGWLVWAEVSYSYYGERGRADLVAWFAPLRILLIVEIKTELVDIQALLGGLDAKRRLAPVIARQLGLGAPALVVPVLLVSDGSTGRGRVRRFESLFSEFPRRGRSAVSWLRHPSRELDGGLLVFSDLRAANGDRVKSVGSHRVRVSGRVASVDSAADAPLERTRVT